jgi:hypothetical protein
MKLMRGDMGMTISLLPSPSDSPVTLGGAATVLAAASAIMSLQIPYVSQEKHVATSLSDFVAWIQNQSGRAHSSHGEHAKWKRRKTRRYVRLYDCLLCLYKLTRPVIRVRARNGKTIEIDNTDAEGRLILAGAFNFQMQY